MLGAPQVASNLGFEGEEEVREALGDALRDLERLGLIDMKSWWLIAIDQEARKIQVTTLRTSWRTIHEIYLDDRQEAFLSGLCGLSEQQAEDRAWLADVHGYDVCDRLGWDRDSDLVAYVVFSLRDAGLLDASRVTMGGGWNIFPTYAGVVRGTESEPSELRDLVVELLPDWETTNVDFKRELHLDTRDQKAEFVRDVLGLVNPRVSGKRYLVIGWDPSTRVFTTPIDAAVTQERIEDVLGHYTRPTVTALYRTFEWEAGQQAAVLEVQRDRSKVPYRVRARLAGERRVIEEGQVYIRRGSHGVLADSDEVADLDAEAAWVRRESVEQESGRPDT